MNSKFEWDNANIGHLARHEIKPEEAEQVILNRPVIWNRSFVVVKKDLLKSVKPTREDF